MLKLGQQPIVYQIKKNTTASELVQDLKNQSLISSKYALLIFIKLNNQEHQLKRGIYQINPDDSALDFINAVTKGDVLKQTFTIVEGTTFKQVLHHLKQSPYLNFDNESFSTIAKTYQNKEGLFLADTYVYDAGSDASTVLIQANNDLMVYLAEQWENKNDNLPYQTPYELLIAASIIEKETSDLSEKPLISSVIINRLNKKMRLQVDPTVIYALGEEYDGKLTKQSLQIDSPYNTYKNIGLPPTPISMVSRASIKAAAHPEYTDFIYFVAKGDGTHQFSITYQEQIKAIEQFLK